MSAYHHNILDLTRSTFPNLTQCEIIDKKKSNKKTTFLPTSTWMNWFLKEETEFEWLRVRITDHLQLIIRHIDSTNYLIVVNESEKIPLLISFLKGIKLVSVNLNQEESPIADIAPFEKSNEMDLQMQDAVRIQNLIIPQEEIIRKKFKKFFAVHQQQDAVGGDFYWYHEMEGHALVALIDCTGHGLEGAMTSMVCNSLLNQVSQSTNCSNLVDLVSNFYELLNKYNRTSDELLDYGIGAEMGVFCFNYQKREISFVSTGISAFVKRNVGNELLRVRKVKDYDKLKLTLQETKISMDGLVGLYAFTDGLTDQYDSSDKKKLGYKGVQRLIEGEDNFGQQYYSNEISKWMGKNMQYDDITLLGMAI